MSSAKITLIGLQNWMTEIKQDLFSDLQLPQGIDKQTFVDSLLLEYGEFEVLYPDPDFLKKSITLWGQKWNRTFTKWYEALQLQYDPISNYDRKEQWTDTIKGTNTADSNGTSGSTNNSKVSAFDSATMQPDSETSVKLNDQNHAENAIDNTSTHIGTVSGNIGVTTSQQMLKSELDISKWNIFAEMCDIFANELLIQVY